MEMPWHTLGSSAVSQPRGILGMHCHYMIPPKKGDFKMMMKHEEILSSCDVLKGGGKTKKTKPWTVLSSPISGWGVVSCGLVIWLVNSTFFNPMFGLRKNQCGFVKYSKIHPETSILGCQFSVVSAVQNRFPRTPETRHRSSFVRQKTAEMVQFAV